MDNTLKRNLKICHVTSVHKSNDIRIFHKECVSLAKAGYEVFLVGAQFNESVESGVSIVNSTTKKRSRLARIFFTSREVYHRALKLDADVYHLHDPELLPYCLKLKRRGKIVIYDAHEDVPKQVLDKHWIPNFLRTFIARIIAKYEARVAKRIDAVISVNEPICDRFKKFNSKVEMIANYPLKDEIQALGDFVPLASKHNQICYVGGLFPTRGIKQLVESLTFTEANLVLAGTFSTKEFEDEVKSLSGWSKVTYLGQVDRSEIIKILGESSIGMVTLLPTASYKESLPIKLFEYMATGIPMICSNFDLWRDLVEKSKCGVCVDPKNPEEIAKAIQHLLNSPELSKEMGQNGRKLVFENYNWEREELKLLNLYTRLVQNAKV